MLPDSEHRKRLRFDAASGYRIVVQGRLKRSMSDRMAGMSIETAKGQGQGMVTMLVGRLRDQAQLNGVLNTLYELHLPVMEVKQLSDE